MVVAPNILYLKVILKVVNQIYRKCLNFDFDTYEL